MSVRPKQIKLLSWAVDAVGGGGESGESPGMGKGHLNQQDYSDNL